MKKKIRGYRQVIKILLSLSTIAAILCYPLFGSSMGLHLAIVGMTGAITALGLNVFYGYCGQINFGSAGFFAIGGYSVALLEKYFRLPYFISLIFAVPISGLIAYLVSFPLLRLREYMLALGTLSFGLAVYEAASKGILTKFTRGEDGIDLSKLHFYGMKAGDGFFFYLLLATILFCFWVSYALRNSRTGRAMVAISQDEIASTSLGVNINSYLVQAFVISGMISALAGGIFVKWAGWCSPEYFSLTTSVVILLAVVVGGVGSAIGSVVGGLIMFILRELLVPLAIYEMLVYGIILCLFFLFMPQGIRGLMNPILTWFKENLKADGTRVTAEG